MSKNQTTKKDVNKSKTVDAGIVLKRTAQLVLCLFLISKLILIGYQIFAHNSLGIVNISVKVVHDLANGNNPYGTSWLYDETALPAPYYESGFFHVLPAVLLVKVFGISATLACGITQLLYVVLALIVMYLCVKRFTGNTTLALFAAAVFHSCIRAHLVDCFRPDTLCALMIVTIFLLIILDEKRLKGEISKEAGAKETENKACEIRETIRTKMKQTESKTQKTKTEHKQRVLKSKPEVCNQNSGKKITLYNRADKKTNLIEWITALLGVLLIFLKIHYASILAALFVYQCKKKRWLPWGLKFCVCGIIITGATQLCFPTFFSTFGIRVIEMMRDNTADSDLMYMFQQWGTLIQQFWLFFGILLAGCFLLLKQKKFRVLFSNPVYFLLFINILVNIAALCYMGKWNGNYINYHYIMIMSSVILAAVFYLHGFMAGENKKQLVTYGVVLGYGLSIAIISISSLTGSLSGYQESKKAREQEYAFLDSYRSEDMLLDPSLAYYTYANDIYQWDYMDQIYIPYDIGSSPRWNFLFPYTNLYRQRCVSYGEEMVQKIRDKKYSIITQSDIHILGLKIGLENEFQDAIEENYVKQEWNGKAYWIPRQAIGM